MRKSFVFLLGALLALPLAGRAEAPAGARLLNSVHFPVDVTELDRPAAILLNGVVAEFAAQPSGHVLVIGFAAPKEGGFSAGPAHAKMLSERRAGSVKYYLAKHGIPQDRIELRGAGLEVPTGGAEDTSRRCVEVYFQ